MKITESIEHEGDFLFKWRSYSPLVLIPILMLCLRETAQMLPAEQASWHHLWIAGCYGVSLIGLFIRWACIAQAPSGTSGRCTSQKIADSLNTRGLYSAVRHPLYLGNFIAILGVVLVTMLWWAILFFVLAYWLYIERIMAAEERFLEQKFGDEFQEWAIRAPAFFPSFRYWRPAAHAVSIKNVLRREYHGILAVGFAVLLIELALDVWVQGENFSIWVQEDAPFVAFFAVALALFLVLRLIKKKTRLLENPLV